MTAAAGARLGIEVHLVLSGDRPDEATGNQLLARLFGAQLHFTGAEESHWGELEMARECADRSSSRARVSSRMRSRSAGVPPSVRSATRARSSNCSISSTPPVSVPAIVVFTSSSGGTHAGLLAGRAAAAHGGRRVPDVIAIGVAKGVNIGRPDIAELARRRAHPDGLDGDRGARGRRGRHLDGWATTMPCRRRSATPPSGGRRTTAPGCSTAPIRGKGCSGLVGSLAAEGRFGDDVVFVHTGGWPALFAADGMPPAAGWRRPVALLP